MDHPEQVSHGYSVEIHGNSWDFRARNSCWNREPELGLGTFCFPGKNWGNSKENPILTKFYFGILILFGSIIIPKIIPRKLSLLPFGFLSQSSGKPGKKNPISGRTEASKFQDPGMGTTFQ